MPPLDAETLAMIQYVLSLQGGMSPTAALGGGVVQPPMNKYGELEPYDVDFQSKVTNQYQNLMSSLADPMSALVGGGVGSFGAAPLGGGIAGGGGLNPLITETILDTPAIRQMKMLAQAQGPVTPETYVANMLVNQGAYPSLIVADLRAKLADPEANGLDDATVNLFTSWLPQTELKDMQGNPTGETTIDWGAATKKIEDVASPYLQETAKVFGPDIRENQLGQYVQYGEKASPTMEYLQKQGLPDPRQQYGIDFAVQNDPELGGLMQSIAAKGQEYDEAQKAYKNYLNKYPVAKAMVDKAAAMKSRRENELYAQDMGQYVRDVADWAKAQAPPPVAVVTAAERNREEPPGWLKSAAGAVGGAIKGTPGYINEMVSGMIPHPPQTPSGGLGYGGVSPLPTPAPKTPPPTRPGIRPPGLLEQMYSRVNANQRNSYPLWKQAQAARTAASPEMLAMVQAIAPGWGAMRAGRTPFKDAVMSRLGPILAAGGANG